jgi:chromosomal replication initiator protein
MDIVELWNKTMENIRKEVSSANFEMWFKDIIPEYEDRGVVFIRVPNPFTKDWFIDKFQKSILRSLREINPAIRSIDYVIGNHKIRQSDRPRAPQLPIHNLYVNKEDNLNPRYTFDSFIVGQFNELAHSAALATIEKPGIYNPLYLYGSSGLGKTHIMQSVGNALKLQNPNLKIYYVSADRFSSDLILSIQKGTAHTFKEKYRSYDILIMDDIQFLSGRDRTQEELFHLFNTFHDRNNQIIFSSDKHPHLITGLEDRLKTRFGAGMIVEVMEPDMECKMAILETKRASLGINCEPDVCEYIALNAPGSIRELEGIMQTLVSHTMLHKRAVNTNDVKAILRHTQQSKKKVSFEEIIDAVAEFYNLKAETLSESTRRKEIVHARQVAMYLLREDYNFSFPFIGKRMGGRDHTTVIHSCEKISREVKTGCPVIQEVETLRSVLKTI